MPRPRPARPVLPKGRELVERALKDGRAKARGAGEASSLRSLARRGLLKPSGDPTPAAQLWAEVHSVSRSSP